jgi:ribosome modulation factor
MANNSMLDTFPTYTLSPAYRRGMRARISGKPITACKCRKLEAIADWRMGWRDAQMTTTRTAVKPVILIPALCEFVALCRSIANDKRSQNQAVAHPSERIGARKASRRRSHRVQDTTKVEK